LVCFGLGSCIGLVLVDRRRRLAGMAHIMLPAPARDEVPALLDELVALGALRPRVEALIAGGAKMFASASDTLETGLRNEEAAGRLPVGSAPPGLTRSRWLRTVDFTRPTKFSTDQERRLRRVHEGFCRAASTRLAAEHRIPLDLEVIEISQLTWSDAHALVPK